MGFDGFLKMMAIPCLCVCLAYLNLVVNRGKE